jgi:hypothetical protein
MSLVLSPRRPQTDIRHKITDVTHLCHACGITNHVAPATSFVYRSGASFCFTCWETLPGSAIRQVIQEVTLRGVPLS